MKHLTTILLLISLQCFSQQHYPIKNMLGINLHQWDVWYYDYDAYKGSFDAKYKALIDLHPSSIRIYLDADGEQDLSGNYAFNPSYVGGFQPETGIRRIKQSNPEIFIQACYHRQTPLIHKDWEAAGAWYSVLNFPYQFNNDVDRVKPSTYSNIAHDLAVITLRAGRNTTGQNYPVYTDVNAPWQNNTLIKGQNFYDAVEGGNEWNGWWGNYNTNMSSPQLAAAWKPMYDSVKATDNTMLFTNGGIAYDKADTFLKAIDWWKSKGYGIPVDYFSYHSYPSAFGQYNFALTGGMNPEEVLYKRAKDMVAAVGNIKPVVIGEWGYDLHPASPQNAPSFGGYTAEQVRAYWSVWAVFKFAQAGIWRAQWYRGYQDYKTNDPRGGNYISDHDSTQFSQMALLRQYNDAGTIIKRTLVGDCFKQIDTQFGDYVFDKVIRDDSLQVLLYKNGINYLYACRSVETYKIVNYRPVFTERKFNYTLNIAGTRYDLNEDSSGVMLSQPFYGGNVQLSTKPFFIVSTTILPVKDKPKPQPKPKPHERFQYRIYNDIGQALSEGFTDDITQKKIELKASMQVQQVLIIKYWNNKGSFYSDKITKQ